MREIFTFAGLINHSHDFIFIFHIVLVGIIAFMLGKLATAKMQLVPSGVQNVMEAYLEGVIFLGKDVVGEQLARKYLPLVATIGMMVATANAIGIIPGFEAPSANLNMTLPLALIVFFYYNFEGIRVNGFKKYCRYSNGNTRVWISSIN